MHRILSTAFLALLASTSLAQQFNVDGTNETLQIDSAILQDSPTWKPGQGAIPLPVERAIEIADVFHRKHKLDKRTVDCSWAFSGAILIAADDDRCYWIISYKGTFGSAFPKGEDGYLYAGPNIRYIHYPVLMTGIVAPARPTIPPKAKKILPMDGTDIQRAGWPQLSERELDRYPDAIR